MTQYYKIHGYDGMMMEDYIEPEKYSTYKEAFAKCKMNNEYVKAYEEEAFDMGPVDKSDKVGAV